MFSATRTAGGVQMCLLCAELNPRKKEDPENNDGQKICCRPNYLDPSFEIVLSRIVHCAIRYSIFLVSDNAGHWKIPKRFNTTHDRVQLDLH